MMWERRCDRCGCLDTGWRALIRGDKRLCPACAQGIERESREKMLVERRALLRRLEEQSENYPGLDRLRGEVRASIYLLERKRP